MNQRVLFAFSAKIGSLIFISQLQAAQAGDRVAVPQREIRVGVITQQHGPHQEIYFSAIASSSSVSAVAVADSSEMIFETAKKKLGHHHDFQAYRNAKTMLREFRPDLVIIALPAYLAPVQIRAALTAGCHVVAEKPACVSAEDFRPLVQLATTRNLTLMLALPARVAPQTLRAKEIITAGWLGQLYGVTFFSVKDQARLTRPNYQQSWFAFPKQAGGGHLIWLGIHDLDRVFFITNDRVEKVTGFTTNAGGQPVAVEDSESVAFRFRSGMLGSFQGGYYVEGGASHANTTLWGSQGWMTLSRRRGPDGSTHTFQWYSTHPEAPHGIRTKSVQGGTNAYHLFVQAAIDAARGARPAPLTPEDCLHVLEVIFGAYRASETGKSQAIPLSVQ